MRRRGNKKKTRINSKQNVSVMTGSKEIANDLTYLANKAGKVQIAKYAKKLENFLNAYDQQDDKDAFVKSLISHPDFSKFLLILRLSFLETQTDQRVFCVRSLSSNKATKKNQILKEDFLIPVINALSSENMNKAGQQLCIKSFEFFGQGVSALLYEILLNGNEEYFCKMLSMLSKNQLTTLLQQTEQDLNVIHCLALSQASQNTVLQVFSLIEECQLDLVELINASTSSEAIEQGYGYIKMTPLHIAFKQHNIELARILLDKGAQIDVSFEDITCAREVPGIYLLLKSCEGHENFDFYHEVKNNYSEAVNRQLRSFSTASFGGKWSEEIQQRCSGNILHFLCEGYKTKLSYGLIKFLILEAPELLLEKGTIRQCTVIYFLLNRREWELLEWAEHEKPLIFEAAPNTELARQHFLDNQGYTPLHIWMIREKEGLETETDYKKLLDFYCRISGSNIWELRNKEGWSLLSHCLMFGSGRRIFDLLVKEIKNQNIEIEPFFLNFRGILPFHTLYYDEREYAMENRQNLENAFLLARPRSFIEQCLLFPEYIDLSTDSLNSVIYSLIFENDYDTLTELTNLLTPQTYIDLYTRPMEINYNSPKLTMAILNIMKNQGDQLSLYGLLNLEEATLSMGLGIQPIKTGNLYFPIMAKHELSPEQLAQTRNAPSFLKVAEPDLKLLVSFACQKIKGNFFEVICQLLKLKIEFNDHPYLSESQPYSNALTFFQKLPKQKGKKRHEPQKNELPSTTITFAHSPKASPALSVNFSDYSIHFEEGCLREVHGFPNFWLYIDKNWLEKACDNPEEIVSQLEQKHFAFGSTVTNMKYVNARLKAHGDFFPSEEESIRPVKWKVTLPPKGDRVFLYSLVGVDQNENQCQILVTGGLIDVHQRALSKTFQVELHPPVTFEKQDSLSPQ